MGVPCNAGVSCAQQPTGFSHSTAHSAVYTSDLRHVHLQPHITWCSVNGASVSQQEGQVANREHPIPQQPRVCPEEAQGSGH